MNPKFVFLCLPLSALAPPAGPIWAQDSTAVSTGTDTASVEKTLSIKSKADVETVLRYNGFGFKTETHDGKDYLVVDVDGITTVVNFFDSKGQLIGDDANREMASMQLYAGFIGDSSVTPQRMNEWNRNHRFTRAYIDNEGDPVLEMDLNLAFGGVPERQLEDSLALWELSVVSFQKFVYPKSDDGKTLGDGAKSFIRKIKE